MILDDSYVAETCKLGKEAECCRWLTIGSDGFRCAKLDPGLHMMIMERIDEGTMKARGDNCDGLPYDGD